MRLSSVPSNLFLCSKRNAPCSVSDLSQILCENHISWASLDVKISTILTKLHIKFLQVSYTLPPVFAFYRSHSVKICMKIKLTAMVLPSHYNLMYAWYWVKEELLSCDLSIAAANTGQNKKKERAHPEQWGEDCNCNWFWMKMHKDEFNISGLAKTDFNLNQGVLILFAVCSIGTTSKKLH